MKSLKIKNVSQNNRRRQIEISTDRGFFTLPYGKLLNPPTLLNPIKGISIDPEMGFEGINIILKNGKEQTIHGDQFLDYHKDVDYLRYIQLHRLGVEAMKLFKKQNLSKRELARRMKTSNAHIHKLLNPANYQKTLDQMFKLLSVLGADVQFEIKKSA